jgi:hypothetical protein
LEFHGAGGMGAGERTRDDLPIPVKVEFDEYYLKNMSFFFDFKILLMTFIKVVKREGVTHLERRRETGGWKTEIVNCLWNSGMNNPM